MPHDLTYPDALPAAFLDELRRLEAEYCWHDDPIRQSGFGGGPQRWRNEREPILDAVDADGDFLDVGCANGCLLQCLVRWAADRGCNIVPHGVDYSPHLIEMAQQRLPDFAENFHVANAWNWHPPRRYRFVYTVCDCVPESYLAAYCQHLLDRAVERNGRLIVGMYGSRSKKIDPIDLGDRLQSLEFIVQGTAQGGHPAVATFAWIAGPAEQ